MEEYDPYKMEPYPEPPRVPAGEKCPACGEELEYESQGYLTFRYVCPKCGKRYHKVMGD